MNNAPKICSICQKDYDEYGNNAWPVNDGRCCNSCDWSIVIPARIRMMRRADKAAADKVETITRAEGQP